MGPPIWGFLQPCLLLLLAEGPQHGYSLLEKLNEQKLLNGVDVGNLYRTLRRMEGAGMVESAWSERGAGPNKRVYRLTPDGEGMLRRWAGALEQRTSLLSRFLDEFHRVYGLDGALAPPEGMNEDEENLI